MIHIYYGDDRIKAQQAIVQLLGKDYEVFDGPELTPGDLPSLFQGTSLFNESRKILIKDFSENKSLADKLVDYLETTHEVVVWEKTFDKRIKQNKELAKHPNVEIKEFKTIKQIDRNLVFNIYDVAMRDGVRAVHLLTPLTTEEDPYRILGAWTWKAIDNYKRNPGAKEKRVLRELSKLDMQMKTTQLSSRPWLLLQSFLLRVSSL